MFYVLSFRFAADLTVPRRRTVRRFHTQPYDNSRGIY